MLASLVVAHHEDSDGVRNGGLRVPISATTTEANCGRLTSSPWTTVSVLSFAPSVSVKSAKPPPAGVSEVEAVIE